MIIPDTLDDALFEILGMPCFRAGGLADVFRAAGHAIPHKAEHEQAFVIFWMLVLYAEHGDAWQNAAREEIQSLLTAAEAAGVQTQDRGLNPEP